MGTETQDIIQLDNILVRYGKLRALDGVSVRCGPGPIGLLGPNGAGKSTLLKTVLGFLLPNGGSGRVLGYDIVKNPLDIRLRVGYMSEDDSYVHGLNAVNFVTYAGELTGMARSDAMQRAHEVINYAGVGELRYRNVESFSTGQKQRIKLAQALIHDPKLLFLDEPTNGLDPKGRQEMLDLIKDISTHKGINLVLSSHLLPDVEYVCSQVIMINKGKIIAHGSIEKLLETQKHQYDIRFKGPWQNFGEALKRLNCSLKHTIDDTYRASLPPGEKPGFFFKLARESGVQIRHLALSKPTLENVFLALVGEEENADL